jgi:neutral ceramidase
MKLRGLMGLTGLVALFSGQVATAQESSGCAGFCAGFGRADITPPPGVGLAGNGPEGKRAVGYRLRLFVRAMVLRDAGGESVALLVADLAHISPTLHRMTAARVAGRTGLTADRIVISATHTHAGPGHFYSERQYNGFGSSVAGYDTAVVNYLVEAFTRAILQGWEALRPARAAWGQIPVWGFTRNRSYPAYLENKPEWSAPFPVPPGLDPVHRAVDPTWTMIRVDLMNAAGEYRPAGAYSIFAIHGTANPPDGDLIDPDIHGLLERGLEDSMDARHGYPPVLPNRAVHIVANGTEGDVSPDWPQSARCGIPRIQPVLRPGGPRTPAGPWEWRHSDTATVTFCIRHARDFIMAAADSITIRIARLYDALGPQLTDTLEIAVAFRTDSLPGLRGLCQAPYTGVSTTAGAEDGPTRLRGWRLFGLFNLGFEEGGSAINPHPRGCHREKRIALGESLQNILTGKNALASVAQLTVVRIGDLLLGATPAEVTTVAGFQMKQTVRDSVKWAGGRVGAVALIGMANGYIQYVTSDAEYRVQHYEGGSTIYGPRSATVLGEQLGSLAGSIARAGGKSPPNTVYDLLANPGDTVSVLPGRNSGPPPAQIDRRAVALECGVDTMIVRWLDAWPGRFFPADTAVLVFVGPRLLSGNARPGTVFNGYGEMAWDGDPRVEIRAIGPRKGRGYIWEARIAGTGTWPRPVHIVALARADFPEKVLGECRWPSDPRAK